MQRRFIGDLVFLQALNWLIKPVWIFWIDRMVQVQLGDDMYGRYYVVFSFSLLFNILLDFGLNNYVAAGVGKSGNPAVAKPVIRLRWYLSGIYIALLVVLGLLQNFDPVILSLAIANQVLSGFVLLFRAVLQGRHRFRHDSIISVTDRFAAILICAVFLYGSGFYGRTGILVFLGSQTAGYALTLLLAGWLAFRKAPAYPGAEAHSLKTSALLRHTAWFAVMAFAMAVFTRIDTQMIRYLAGDGFAEAGRYARSYRLLDAAVIFSGLISTLLLPMFSRMVAENKSTDTLVWLNTRIVLFVSIGVALATVFYGSDILSLLYGDLMAGTTESRRALGIFIPVMATFIPMALVHVFGTWLTAADRLKMLSLIALSAVVLNVLLNAFFIPEFGAQGSAYSGLITQSAFALACMAGAWRMKAFEFSLKRFVQIVVWLTGSIFAVVLISHYVTGITGLLAAASAFLAATIITGLFYPEIRKFFFSAG